MEQNAFASDMDAFTAPCANPHLPRHNVVYRTANTSTNSTNHRRTSSFQVDSIVEGWLSKRHTSLFPMFNPPLQSRRGSSQQQTNASGSGIVQMSSHSEDTHNTVQDVTLHAVAATASAVAATPASRLRWRPVYVRFAAPTLLWYEPKVTGTVSLTAGARRGYVLLWGAGQGHTLMPMNAMHTLAHAANGTGTAESAHGFLAAPRQHSRAPSVGGPLRLLPPETRPSSLALTTASAQADRALTALAQACVALAQAGANAHEKSVAAASLLCISAGESRSLSALGHSTQKDHTGSFEHSLRTLSALPHEACVLEVPPSALTLNSTAPALSHTQCSHGLCRALNDAARAARLLSTSEAIWIPSATSTTIGTTMTIDGSNQDRLIPFQPVPPVPARGDREHNPASMRECAVCLAAFSLLRSRRQCAHCHAACCSACLTETATSTPAPVPVMHAGPASESCLSASGSATYLNAHSGAGNGGAGQPVKVCPECKWACDEQTYLLNAAIKNSNVHSTTSTAAPRLWPLTVCFPHSGRARPLHLALRSAAERARWTRAFTLAVVSPWLPQMPLLPQAAEAATRCGNSSDTYCDGWVYKLSSNGNWKRKFLILNNGTLYMCDLAAKGSFVVTPSTFAEIAAEGNHQTLPISTVSATLERTSATSLARGSLSVGASSAGINGGHPLPSMSGFAYRLNITSQSSSCETGQFRLKWRRGSTSSGNGSDDYKISFGTDCAHSRDEWIRVINAAAVSCVTSGEMRKTADDNLMLRTFQDSASKLPDGREPNVGGRGVMNALHAAAVGLSLTERLRSAGACEDFISTVLNSCANHGHENDRLSSAAKSSPNNDITRDIRRRAMDTATHALSQRSTPSPTSSSASRSYAQYRSTVTQAAPTGHVTLVFTDVQVRFIDRKFHCIQFIVIY